jgi:hypothetical protein
VPGYNRRMTTTATPSAPGSMLAAELAGLAPTDAARIIDAIAANYAPNTLHAYAWAWSHWAAWCAGRDLDPLPATPAAVCAYLAERAEQGIAFGTISLTCCAIAFEHRRAGAVDPTGHEAVRQVRRGLRRSLGTAPNPAGPAALRGRDPCHRHPHRPHQRPGRPGRRADPARVRLRAAPL